MNLPSLIALSGKAGSGKDTLGREVLRPLGFSQFALSWHMKNEAVGGILQQAETCDSCDRLTGGRNNCSQCVPRALLKPEYNEVHVKKPPFIRDWLQQRGTENGWQKFGKDYWLRITDAWMRTLSENCGLSRFYITDVRFPHEVEWVQKQDGIVIRITGRGGLEGETANHLSETALDDYRRFDAYLDNSGSLSDSCDYLRGILEAY